MKNKAAQKAWIARGRDGLVCGVASANDRAAARHLFGKVLEGFTVKEMERNTALCLPKPGQ